MSTEDQDRKKDDSKGGSPQDPLREIVQPFIDLVHAPRALWGVNIAYFLEGMVYFGMLGYLAMHFSDFVFQAVGHADEWAHDMMAVLTGGITLAMVFLGTIADKRGIRFALIAAFLFMLGGRVLMSGAPNVFGLEPTRPQVEVGDKVSLHVTELGMRSGVKTVLAADVVADDDVKHPVDTQIARALSEGNGTAPDASMESQLVRVQGVTLTQGGGQEWKGEYGAGNVKADFFMTAAETYGLCQGAKLDIEHAYVTRQGETYSIRSHWKSDLKNVDVSGCSKPGTVASGLREDSLRATSRGKIAPAPSGVQEVTIAQLRSLEGYDPIEVYVQNTFGFDASWLRDTAGGRVNVLLQDVYVTYVRNGGYFVQATKDGPAIEVFVNPKWSWLHIATLLGMVLVVIGYGMYQPAAYAGVRKFTTPKTAAMGFAMLYALMNLGGWLPTFAFLLRDDDYLGLGIPGTYWVYTGFTVLALTATVLLLSKQTVERAIAAANAEADSDKKAQVDAKDEKKGDKVQEDFTPAAGRTSIPFHLWLFLGASLGLLAWRIDWLARFVVAGILLVLALGLLAIGARIRGNVVRWVANHPLADAKFFFFIFALIPVQTLFTYNWLVLPQYISRSFAGWIGEYFEIAANANPILIFIAVPMIAAITQKSQVYRMMIIGTIVMAAPAFLLTIGPYWWTLGAYILIMTIGEAIWQPRFLQYAAEIAPENRTGEYMGVAQLPWFLTKVLVPLLYSGWAMDRFCPAEGPKNTEAMWLMFGCIAMASPVLLIAFKGWVGKDFKAKA